MNRLMNYTYIFYYLVSDLLKLIFFFFLVCRSLVVV